MSRQHTPQTISAALAYIPNDDRDIWVSMGMAVKSELGDSGFDVWNEWSQGAGNYNAKDTQIAWRSFKEGGPIGIGTLLYEAKQRGFKPNGHGRQIDAAEWEWIRQEREIRQRAEAERRAKEEAAAAQLAEEIYRAAVPAADHPYLTRKGIPACAGLRVGRWRQVGADGKRFREKENCLLVPMRDADGKLWNVQAIFPEHDTNLERDKDYLLGGRKQGTYFSIGKPEGVVVIGEGLATMASIRVSTGLAVCIAFDKGNLAPVAQALRSKLPDVRLILSADNDIREGKPNYGVEKSTDAAAQVGGYLAIPELDGQKADFNDLHQAKGPEAVKAAIEGAQSVAPKEQQEGDKKMNSNVARVSVDAGIPGDEVDGDKILQEVDMFLGRFVAYPSKHARTAHALWIAHAHLMDEWESTPRIAFLSPEPGSGKTRALEITETLVPNAIEAINASPAYLFRRISNEDEGTPTILFDEIDTIFGPKAKENEELRGIINAGHRRGAMAGRCVVRGKVIETEELPAYCALAVAGLGALPDTILSRSVIVRMRRRAPGEQIEPYRRRIHAPAGNAIRDKLHAWTSSLSGRLRSSWPEMPPGIEDRNADVWEALLAVADAAGGEWPRIAREAAVALVADSKQNTPSLGVRLLEDLRTVFKNNDTMSTEEITKALAALDEAPWGDLKGKPIDARRLSRYLQPYGVSSKNIRKDGHGPVTKGYKREDLHDPWSRYLGPSPIASATTATAATAADDVEVIS